MKHHSKLFFAALLSTLCLSGQAASGKTPVVDQTGLNGFQAYLDKNLPAPVQATIAAQGLAVWGTSDAIELQGEAYCVALAGITTASKDQRMARRPQQVQSSVVRYTNLDKDWVADCRAEALRNAIAELAQAPLPDAAALQRTLVAGGTRPNENADSKTVQLASQNVSAATKSAVFDTIHEYDLGSAVDYRQVQTVLFNDSFTMKSGKHVCYALVSLSARSPGDRQPRLSIAAANASAIKVGDEATCERDASVLAVKTFFNQPWTAKGIFNGFDKTREDGVPLPDIAAVAKKRAAAVVRAAAAEKRAATRVASTQSNVVRCSNVCTNGSCLRTFENGRTERWQAPRIRDPFSNNWTWDINTNACGQ